MVENYELVDVVTRRNVNILCVQETKWVGQNAEAENNGFKLWYSGLVENKNGVDIMIDKSLNNIVVDI